MNKRLTLLGFASWLLLGVSWVMSVYAYPRLPEEAALWTSLWSSQAVKGTKSTAFFIYPLAQTLLFLMYIGLARAAFFRTPGPDSEDRRLRGRVRMAYGRADFGLHRKSSRV